MVDTATAAYQRVGTLLGELTQAYDDQEQNVYYTYSRLWSGILAQRPAADDVNDLFTLLNAANRRGDGVAGTNLDPERYIRYYRSFVTAEMHDSLPLSMVGTPTIFDFEGRATNVPYVENLRLHGAIVDTLRRFDRADRKLRVIEIGAGYGGLASLLLASGVADSYTIIDLPDNLTLSAFYLTEQYPDRARRVHSRRSPVGAIEAGSLNFVPVGHITAIDGCRFDLIVNTDSLGEMNARTAHAYVGWIAEHLDEHGVFYSKNGHRRTPDGVARASALGYDRLAPLMLQPRSIASGLFDDHGHEALLARRTAVSTPPPTPDQIDTMCDLFALGLRGELLELSAAVVTGTLTPAQARFLADAARFFASGNYQAQAAVFSPGDDEALNAVATFARGVALHLGGKRSEAGEALRRYLPRSRSPIAEATSLFVLAQYGEKLPDAFANGGETAFLVDDINAILTMPPVLRRAACALRNEQLRKKLTPPERYRPSALLRAKNVAFNLRDRRKLSMERY